jgi:hypothetical protein
VVQPSRLASPRYADCTKSTIAKTSDNVASLKATADPAKSISLFCPIKRARASGLSGWLSRSSDRRLTVALGIGSRRTALGPALGGMPRERACADQLDGICGYSANEAPACSIGALRPGEPGPAICHVMPAGYRPRRWWSASRRPMQSGNEPTSRWSSSCDHHGVPTKTCRMVGSSILARQPRTLSRVANVSVRELDSAS